MYVKTTRENLQAIKTPEMDSVAEFSSNNIAQVSESDGVALCENYPEDFSEHES